jgi:hypothetical protein
VADTDLTLPRRSHRKLLLCFAAISFALSLAQSASAQSTLKDRGSHRRPQMLSALAGFHFDSRYGAGFPMVLSGRYYYPLVPDGFASGLNDEFGLEGGLDLLLRFGSGDAGIGLPFTGLYALHFTDRFDAYAKLGFSIHIHRNAHVRPYAAFGIRLKLNESLYFRAEAGYPLLLAGIAFAF